MPKKKKSAPQGLTPQQIDQMNSNAVRNQMQLLPPLEFGDIFSNSQQMMGSLTDRALDPFMSLIERGEETMANNPMLPLMEVLGNPRPDPQLSAYEMRIRELMENRGWTREKAVANQDRALVTGTDFDNDGAISNDEWARHLGADYDNSGGVSNQEWAKYQAAQQPAPQPMQQPVQQPMQQPMQQPVVNPVQQTNPQVPIGAANYSAGQSPVAPAMPVPSFLRGRR